MKFSDFEPPTPTISEVTSVIGCAESMLHEVGVELRLSHGRITPDSTPLMVENIAAVRCALLVLECEVITATRREAV